MNRFKIKLSTKMLFEKSSISKDLSHVTYVFTAPKPTLKTY